MNKIIKFGQFCLMAMLAVAFNACTEEYDYDPTTDTDNQGAYILSDATSLVLTEEDPQQLTFTVARHDTTAAATYRLYTDTEGFNIPSEVSFAAGEKSQTFTVSFDVPSGTVNKQVVIGIQDEDAYTYGAHSLTFIISRLKKVTGAEYFESGLFYAYATWEANVYENGFTRNKDGSTVASYLVMEPFHDSGFEEDMGLNESETTGYQYVFNLLSDGTAELISCNGLFYITAALTGDPAITGVALPSGDGAYYSNPTTLYPGFTISNFVMFPWNISIGSTGYGFTAVSMQGVIFPDGYNPITQNQATQE